MAVFSSQCLACLPPPLEGAAPSPNSRQSTWARILPAFHCDQCRNLPRLRSLDWVLVHCGFSAAASNPHFISFVPRPISQGIGLFCLPLKRLMATLTTNEVHRGTSRHNPHSTLMK